MAMRLFLKSKRQCFFVGVLLSAGFVLADHYNWVGDLWIGAPGTEWSTPHHWYVQETANAAEAFPGVNSHVIIDEYLYGNHITTMPVVSTDVGAIQYLTLGWNDVGATRLEITDGGQVYVSQFATLGHLAGSSGILDMTGGTLVANILNVGNDGGGVVNLSGNSLLHAGVIGFGVGGGVVSMADDSVLVVNGDVSASNLAGNGYVVAANPGDSIQEFYNAALGRTEFRVYSAAAAWIEAEDAQIETFTPGLKLMNEMDGASGGIYLHLETDYGTNLPFYAEYQFSAPESGQYLFWVASTPQNSGWASPLYYRIDTGPFFALEGMAWESSSYGVGDVFGWLRAGTPTLEAGEHTLRFEVRDQRDADSLYVAFIDAMLLTTDSTYVPSGNRPEYSPHPVWSEAYAADVEYSLYDKKMDATNEEVGSETAEEVRQKIMARPLPGPEDRAADRRFGVHGMEQPFVVAGVNDTQTSDAYELLARTGVQTFRTADSCWHRLGSDYDDFQNLDYQVAHAEMYGQTFMFTIGYPASQFTVGNFMLSACKSEYYPLYRDYLQTLFGRYKDKHIIDYAELGNEVDAPDIWWRNSTPEMYVSEMQVLQQELAGIDPGIKTLAFASTYARDDLPRTQDGGRDFVRNCFDLGIDQYADAYSLHYTSGIKEQDFVDFFRQELSDAGSPGKPLLCSEETRYERPSDIVKCFARDFFLHGMKRLDYFLARDFFENGILMHGGLFDLAWNPKLRLLAYAMSVDTMKDRHLVGISVPEPGVEAYVLEFNDGFGMGEPAYSIVLWKEDITQSLTSYVSGFKDVVSAVSWRLDDIGFDVDNPVFEVSPDPIAVFADEIPPAWILYPTIPTDFSKKYLVFDSFDAPDHADANWLYEIRQTKGTIAAPYNGNPDLYNITNFSGSGKLHQYWSQAFANHTTDLGSALAGKDFEFSCKVAQLEESDAWTSIYLFDETGGRDDSRLGMQVPGAASPWSFIFYFGAGPGQEVFGIDADWFSELAPFDKAEEHTFRFVSHDGSTYEVYVDGVEIFDGETMGLPDALPYQFDGVQRRIGIVGNMPSDPAKGAFYDDIYVKVLKGTSYEEWVEEDTDLSLAIGLNETRSGDPDGDGANNLLEYVLGGNPLVSDAASILPSCSFSVPDTWEYVYRRRVDASTRGLEYGLALNVDDLKTDAWTNYGTVFEMDTAMIDSEFESVTNRIDVSGINAGFLRLNVEEDEP